MGVRYGQKRPRLHDLRNPTDIVTYTIGVKDFAMSHYDEQLVSDIINEKLDAQYVKLKRKTEFFERCGSNWAVCEAPRM